MDPVGPVQLVAVRVEDGKGRFLRRLRRNQGKGISRKAVVLAVKDIVLTLCRIYRIIQSPGLPSGPSQMAVNDPRVLREEFGNDSPQVRSRVFIDDDELEGPVGLGHDGLYAVTEVEPVCMRCIYYY